jgi:hypothetical protein
MNRCNVCNNILPEDETTSTCYSCARRFARDDDSNTNINFINQVFMAEALSDLGSSSSCDTTSSSDSSCSYDSSSGSDSGGSCDSGGC